MSTELLAPFGLTPSGQVAVTDDPRVQARQHVTALVSTNPGERVMLPEYGVALSGLVFAPDNVVVAQTVQRDVTQALAAWEPGISVTSVIPAPGQDPTTGAAMVDVDFQQGMTASPGAAVQTATILIGGQVISDNP